jgi:hypothetical protein
MDKRHAERRRTYKGGKIVFNHGRSAIDCTIKNMSRGGAALNVDSSLGIPNEFILVVSPENAQKACRVAWKTETLIGIAFLEA